MARQAWEVTREMFLDEAEVDRLLESVRGQVALAAGWRRLAARLDEFIVETLLLSGLRNSEFCSLTLADTVAGHGRSEFVVRRGTRQERTVRVPRRVSSLLLRYVRDVRPMLLPDGVDAGDQIQPVAFTERRRAFSRSSLYRRVVRILTRAGLGSRASVQLLRHTYGYLAYLRTGGNLLFVQRQLGHAHPMVTIVYAKFVNEDYGDLADRIAGAPAGGAIASLAAVAGIATQESNHDDQ